MLENYLFFCYICLKLVEIQLPNPVCIELFSCCMQYIAAFLGIVKNLLSYMSSVVQFGFLDNLFCWNNFNHFGVCKLHWFYQLLIYITTSFSASSVCFCSIPVIAACVYNLKHFCRSFVVPWVLNTVYRITLVSS